MEQNHFFSIQQAISLLPDLDLKSSITRKMTKQTQCNDLPALFTQGLYQTPPMFACVYMCACVYCDSGWMWPEETVIAVRLAGGGRLSNYLHAGLLYRLIN